MDRLSENAIELNEIEVFNNCSYSCYMNIGNALDELKRYEYIKEKCMLLEFPHTIGKITFYSKQELEEQGMFLKLNAPIEEIIRCAMCTNIMRSDRGCDGGCQVDERLFNKIMDEILKSELK